MTLMLGLDTGGTYTDAVICDDTAPGPGIVAKAKALTTRHDLSIGIGEAIDAVLPGTVGRAVGLVSMSTTLATNALVEGQGGRVCLILIGFGPKALDRAGLRQAIGTAPVVFAAGGHDATGTRQAPLDRAAIAAAVAEHRTEVDAFAVIAHFGSRDPEDEVAARAIIAEASALPVTCGHELSQSLGGPKRALTALLNARLIGMIADLIAATERILAARGIAAPLMLVRGDGAMVSARFARARPIETILSGPAASLVGAAHLTGIRDAVVSDIGGTTTDIAILRAGRPSLSPDGAMVGGHRTMVDAVAVTTHGLGGDSEVQVDGTSLDTALILGPRRVIPLSLLAMDHGEIVHRHLNEALARAIPGQHDGAFLQRRPDVGSAPGLRAQDRALLDRLGEAPVAAASVLATRLDNAALSRLLARGLVARAGLTPTDAAHALGRHTPWDRVAAQKGAALMARQKTARGTPAAPDAEAMAKLIHADLRRRSAEMLLDAALAHDGLDMPRPSQTPLARRALDGHMGAARIEIGLAYPLIGLGASAALHYPGIAETLRTAAIVPRDADVANAIGAVVGQVRVERIVTVTQPTEGLFRVHLPDGTKDVADHGHARALAETAALAEAGAAARAAGADTPEIAVTWIAEIATVDGKEMFVEGTARAVAAGRPRVAAGRPVV